MNLGRLPCDQERLAVNVQKKTIPWISFNEMVIIVFLWKKFLTLTKHNSL